jgi:hypothetical protein
MIQVGIPLVSLFLIVSLSGFSFKCLFGEDVSSRSCHFGLFLSHKSSWGTRAAKTLIPSVHVGIQNRGLTKICWGRHLETSSYKSKTAFGTKARFWD